MWARRMGHLPFYQVSDCEGGVIEGLACREFGVVVGEVEAEAIVVVARDEVEMEVEYLLARSLSVGD